MVLNNNQILEWFHSPAIKLATVSGVWSTKPAIIQRIDEDFPEIDMITTKSFQVNPNPGNREPIIAEKGTGTFANAVGLRNPGLAVVKGELKALREKHQFRALLNVSLSGSTPEEFCLLASELEPYADIFELNFSCPHAKPGYGSSIGSTANLVAEYVAAIRKATNKLIFPKLTPNVNNIGEIAKAAIEAGADGIAAINTVGPEQIIEPHSGKPILYNPLGHKGGVSGQEILPIAIEKIGEIRQAIGPRIPIIGMGGVFRAIDARKLMEAGADVIGLGTVLAYVPGKFRKQYLQEFRKDISQATQNADAYILNRDVASYQAAQISMIDEPTQSFRVVTVTGAKMPYSSSQYAFIWIPGAGEKPISIAWDDPLTFVVRKRDYSQAENRGELTHAFFQLKIGDTFYIRGPYSASAPLTKKNQAIILSGGTGIGVVPRLAQELKKAGKKVSVLHGAAREEEIVLKELISPYADFIPVADDGKPGRVLELFQDFETEANDTAFYTIGPEILMEKGLQMALAKGIAADSAFASLETNNMCGIGICGECEVGGVLSCQKGTFYNAAYLKKHYFKKLQLL
jgi:dihydroorotate dehydrogenase electron transfer subunit